jgi:hypothetical protein
MRYLLLAILLSINAHAEYISHGGNGNVNGPGSSLLYSTPVFSDTTGKNLEDAQTSSTMKVPVGDTTDFGGVLGQEFAGSGINGPVLSGTGFKVVNPGGANIDDLELLVGGHPFLDFQANPGSSSYRLTLEGIGVRPNIGTDINFGEFGNPFQWLYFKNFKFGNNVATGRTLAVVSAYASGSGAVSSFGLGFDTTTVNEVYFNAFNSAAYVDFINFTAALRSSTISAPNDAVADSNHAIDLVLKGANKTGGTGKGGDTILSVGTSAGGAAGNVFIPSGAPPSDTPNSHSGETAVKYDTTNHKLCAYDGGAWLCSAAFTP